MKRTFILFMVGFAAIATVAYLVYLLIDAFHAMYKDWQLGKELSQLETWSRQKKKASPDNENGPDNPARP